MLETSLGPVQEEGAKTYLRPETAQGIFVNFKHVHQTSRQKIPFGIAQIGKAFRNEITPGNFIFRTREFEQMELEFFCDPKSDTTWHEYWVKERFAWYLAYGIRKDLLRVRASDIEYKFPFGWSELEGIANRRDFDLSQHQEHSGEDLTYFDEETKENYLPYVIEPSSGADRATLAFLVDAYREEEVVSPKGEKETRVVLKLHKDLAPVKVAILPLLSNNEGIVSKAQQLYEHLRTMTVCEYDKAGSIGKRYRRHDEIGTPYCVTVDHESLEQESVTVRDRDSMEQERVAIRDLPSFFQKQFSHSSL
jgi:glycyl-tRNA synthetase